MNKIRFFLFFTVCFFCFVAKAQNSAVKKSADAVFTLTTYKADGSILKTSNGVFISTDGTAISPWYPFNGADHAIIIDSKGIRYDVEVLLGANEIYDLAKFRIKGKATAQVPLLPTIQSKGTSVWIIPNRKSDNPQKANVTNVETFMDKYAYYILSSTANEMLSGCPVVDDNGHLLGLFNTSSTIQSVTDAHYAQDFKLTGLSQNDPTMRQSQIRIAIPDDLQQAQLALMLARERGEADYESTINDFIQQFPSSTDGYYAKALLKANQKDYSAAENSMQQALQKASSKEEAHYNYARLALSISEQEETIEEKSKQTDKALEQIHKAYRLSPQPQYQQLEAQILFVKGGYQQAYELFIALTKSPIRNGELFYEAALAREQLNGTNEEIYALLDSAVCACDTPYTAIAAPYILARALQRDKMADYRNAMLDFFRYEALMYGRLSADFYFMRGQSEMRGKIFQPALNDLAHAVMLDPNNTLYWAELASANLRVGQRKEAIMAAQHCLDLDSEQADALLILGISQAEDGEKKEGLKNIQRAKELGNEQADKFLNKFK